MFKRFSVPGVTDIGIREFMDRLLALFWLIIWENALPVQRRRNKERRLGTAVASREMRVIARWGMRT